MMHFAKIKPEDINNGPGFRVSLFINGYTENMMESYKHEYKDFKGGYEFTRHIALKLTDLINIKKISGLSVLGGEPLQQGKEMLYFLKLVRAKCPRKSIWIWTAYTYEELNKEQIEIVKEADVLIDGRFVESLKSTNLKFRKSSNQRVIDIQETINQGHIVLSKWHI